jgi:hypothetical protein
MRIKLFIVGCGQTYIANVGRVVAYCKQTLSDTWRQCVVYQELFAGLRRGNWRSRTASEA